MDLAPWEPQALGVGGMQRLKPLKVLKLLQAAASAKFAFAFAFAAASPTTTTWLPTHQAFGPWSKGGTWQSKLTLSEKSVFCRVLLENVFSSECSLV